MVGERIRDAQFRDRYGAVVMAVARNGERYPEIWVVSAWKPVTRCCWKPTGLRQPPALQ